MHLLPDSWVIYPVHWVDVGSVFPAPGTTGIEAEETLWRRWEVTKAGEGDEVKTGTESTMWTSPCVAHTDRNFKRVELDILPGRHCCAKHRFQLC